MPRRATAMAAAGVILAGVAGALVFRREPAAAPEPPAAAAESEVLVRRRPSSGPSGVRSAAPLINQVEAQTHSPPTSSPSPSTPAPPERLAKTPSMPPRYNPFSQPPSNTAAPNPPFTTPAFQPSPVQAPSSYAPPPYVPPGIERTGEKPVTPDAAPVPPHSQPIQARTHIVVDGDTLTDLAELYLGSGRRYPEIFEANRDVLQHPDLLPIGARLRIPGDGRVSPLTAKADDLVPIPANAWRRGRGKEP